MSGMCSIYKISNSINEKIYIGQTWTTIKHRFGQHLTGKKSPTVKLSNAINKYGKNNFQIKLITLCGTQEAADQVEVMLIKQFDCIENGYNIHPGGKGGKGYKMSEEHKNKLSESHKGIMHSKEYKIMMSDRMKNINTWSKGNTNRKGKKTSDEGRKKISEAGMGKKASKETKVKMSQTQKFIGNKPDPKYHAQAIEASRKITRNKTWKVIDGKRTWIDRETIKGGV